MNLIKVTSKALNTYRSDPVLIQVDLCDEGRGYPTGQQSSASELGSEASVPMKFLLLGTCVALKQSQRRAGGEEGPLGSSL